MASAKKGNCDSDSSEEEVRSNFYSGAARRFKQEKKSSFPSGLVNLIADKPSLNKSYNKRARSSDTDSSDEEIFRDLNSSSKADEEDADESQDYKNLQQIETLDEDCLISPVDEQPYLKPEQKENHLSNSVEHDIEEIEEDDPLFCDPINDSVFLFMLYLFSLK